MALTEIIAMLRSKDKIIYPITQLKNITDDADALTAPADADSIPLADASDSGQMKKITWANIKTVLSSLFAAKSHVHYNTDINVNTSSSGANLTYYTDRGFIDRAGANRLAFMPATAVKIEYSEDGGETWIDYGATDEQKRQLFAMTAESPLAVTKNVSSSRAVTTNDRLRITVSATDRYSNVDQAYIWYSTQGHNCTCDIECSTIGAKETFNTLRSNINIGGWSGPNTIYFSHGTFGGHSDSSRYAYRFTFKVTSVHSTYKYSSPILYEIRMYGPSVWAVANNMMKNGHLYSWDHEQNATFPANIEAEKFIGAVASQSEDGLMSASDKEKLDAMKQDAITAYIQDSEPSENGCIWIKPIKGR